MPDQPAEIEIVVRVTPLRVFAALIALALLAPALAMTGEQVVAAIRYGSSASVLRFLIVTGDPRLDTVRGEVNPNATLSAPYRAAGTRGQIAADLTGIPVDDGNAVSLATTGGRTILSAGSGVVELGRKDTDGANPEFHVRGNVQVTGCLYLRGNPLCNWTPP